LKSQYTIFVAIFGIENTSLLQRIINLLKTDKLM